MIALGTSWQKTQEQQDPHPTGLATGWYPVCSEGSQVCPVSPVEADSSPFLDRRGHREIGTMLEEGHGANSRQSWEENADLPTRRFSDSPSCQGEAQPEGEYPFV